MFKVISAFADLQDDSFAYYVGDKYPRDGYAPTPERVKELSGDKNKLGKVLIEAVAEAKEEPEEVPVEKPEEAPAEKPKTKKKK